MQTTTYEPGRDALHLTVLDSDGGRQDPVSVGRHGCDYAWTANYAAYRCLPHRWQPGSDSSYAAYQAADDDES